MKPVRFTAQAELDLEEVGDYIAADNPSLALAFVQSVAWWFAPGKRRMRFAYPAYNCTEIQAWGG